ncbi:ABC transporter permease [Aliiglaciecola sp. 3_MG-2023]|uniref:ABC transporter permease n=1 Tax=Aliiglaciecola sp. 3_MG-2023 TaxID=3062644 RepID=UPI0026E4516B|nr:ABC transporter permease [Aliiglaciecola sp. 3_MG-2023]MDO6693994.1 ABC transporter permease [Aliiglaciecola sp. 3_MG-2023]
MIKSIHEVLWVILKSYDLQKYRLCLILLAMIMGCAGLSSVLVINETAKRSYSQTAFPFLDNVEYAIYPSQSGWISKADYADLRKNGNRNLIAVSTQQVESLDNHKLDFLGVDYYALMSLNRTRLEKDNSKSGFPLFAANNHSSNSTPTEHKFVIDVEYAKTLGAKNQLTTDNFLKLNSQLSIGPVAIVEAAGLGEQIVCDIETLYSQFNPQGISYILVAGKFNHKQPSPLQLQLPSHLKLIKLTSTEDLDQLTASFHLNLFAMGLLMFVVCMFVVLNALNLLIIKRVPMLTTLRQLGIPIVAIYSAIIIEMMTLAIACSAIGVTLGIEIAKWLSPSVTQTLANLYNVSINFENFSWFNLYAQVLLASVVGLSLAAALPLRSLNQHLTSIQPVASPAHSENKWLAFCVLLLLICLIIYFSNESIFSSFLIIGLVIISGCFLVLYMLPRLLCLIIPIIPLTTPNLRWSVADAKRISNKSSIAFCAFFIAVATNVGMNLMVNSFRLATDTWITQRLDADAYVNTKDAEQVVTLLSSNFPKTTTFVRQSETGNYQGDAIQLRSYPSNLEHQEALMLEQSIATPWDTFSKAQGIFINQQFALSKQLNLGQKIVFRRQNNHTFTVQIVGIYYDYGNPKAQALVSESLILNPSSGNQVIALYNQGVNQSWLPELKNQISTQFPDAQIVETQDLLKRSMQTFDNTFVVTQGLNIITLLVAAFSLASSLIVIDYDNRPQRALIRAMGVPALKILMLTLFQYTLLCLFICALAIPFGILLSWLLIHLVNVQAFYWSYPLVIESNTLVELILSALMVVFLAVLLPAARTILIPPIEDIKWLNG